MHERRQNIQVAQKHVGLHNDEALLSADVSEICWHKRVSHIVNYRLSIDKDDCDLNGKHSNFNWFGDGSANMPH